MRAAVDTGTHYLDSTGEQTYMRMVFERLGPEAERRGVALVPAMGFDYVPGDCIAASGRGGPRAAGAAHARLRGQGLRHEPGNDAVRPRDDEGRRRRLRERRLAPRLARRLPGELRLPAADRRAVDGPLPVRRGDHRPAPHAHAERQLADHSSHRGARPARAAAAVPAAGPRSDAANPAAAGARPRDRPPARGPVRRTSAGRPSSRSWPRHGARTAGSAGGSCAGSDVYGLTAVTLVHGAELMWAEGYDRSGALGPAAAYDPRRFLDYLTAHGVSWELERPPA